MTIPKYRLINPQTNRCFVFKWEPFGLKTLWHYHPELEMIFFIKGKTSAVIGNGFQEFDEGDLVLLGKDFPHVLQEHITFKKEFPDIEPFGLIIQFTEEFLGIDFIEKAELEPIKKLFSEARRGIRFGKNITEKVRPQLLNMYLLNDTRKLLSLIDILATLGESNEFTYFLTSSEFDNYCPFDEDRMQKINQYVYDHFKEEITLEKIASVSNMTITSFCRYFRSRTLKTFTRFLNEVRIAYACKLLNDDKYSVMDVCFQCGFNSLSYFNRQFKLIMKMSPRHYKTWKKKALESELENA